ncbi:MAG: dihydroneopterin aldolase [Xanthobacteraceae bacterium]|nr:dihydroneopterin aldolase [Xanthobacteraceae bacterium]MCW5678092.1 dihydroneopterin aldolase [Xanthobacteraceae bacterium]
MNGVIEIVGLVIFAKHGVGEEEARLGQRFILDIRLDVDVTEAVKHDRLADTVDYGEVVAVTESVFRGKRFYLIEAAAAHVAAGILAHFPALKNARVTVKKPSAPIAAVFDYVATTVEKKRDA